MRATEPTAAAGAGIEGGTAVEVSAVVEIQDVTRTFTGTAGTVHALNGVSLSVPRGALVAVRGRSGAGKTTLLNIIGGLDRPTSGRVQVAGVELTGAGEKQLIELRRSTIAFVFQAFGLLPILSAAENVGVPLRILKTPRRDRDERVALMLELTGLSQHANQRPTELSGGQQQRVALARALAARPTLLIADEPTGQLDSDTARQIMRLLRTVVHAEGVTALVATHDHSLLDLADSVLTLQDGRIVES